MKLNLESLENREQWISRGYKIPAYNKKEVDARTSEAPVWIHFGAGNIFRAFLANLAETLLNSGESDKGVIVSEGYDFEIIDKMYVPFDNLTVFTALKADSTIEKRVIGSIAKSTVLDPERTDDFKYLKNAFAADTLQMATFTITEKGYDVTNGKGELKPDVEADFKAGPEKPQSYLGKVASLLYERFKNNKKPIAMVSCDNCSHNGDKLLAGIEAFAKAWTGNGVCDDGFLEYIHSDSVSFPWSMIDKITPRPDDSVKKLLIADGLENTEAVITSKSTYIAPFVNAEETEYLVIEDDFPNGRPALEKAGVLFTDRQTVEKVERMKVCTCLNPLHTALAVFGCLLGYTKISEEMKDTDLVRLVKRIGYTEGLPVVTDPKILNPREFIDTVVNVRIPNPFMPDTPQRIACDTSKKLPIRFGETLKEYLKKDKESVKKLIGIQLVFAGWLRYLLGINDAGETFEPSPDPNLAEAQKYVKGIRIGEKLSEEQRKNAEKLLRNEEIFGVDLKEAGLSENIINIFEKLVSAPGAVRNAIKDVQ